MSNIVQFVGDKNYYCYPVLNNTIKSKSTIVYRCRESRRTIKPFLFNMSSRRPVVMLNRIGLQFSNLMSPNIVRRITSPAYDAISKGTSQYEYFKKSINKNYYETNDTMDTNTEDLLKELDPVDENNMSKRFPDDSLMDPDFNPHSENETEIDQSIIDNTLTEIYESCNDSNRNLSGCSFEQNLTNIESTTETSSGLCSENIIDLITVDNRFKAVPTSNSGSKKYFCFFCKKEVCNFGRHLVNVHKHENEVKCILALPKGHPERQKKIEVLRNKGTFTFNKLDNGQCTIHVKRRPGSISNRSANHYKACPYCQQMYSKLSIRVHVKKCKNLAAQESPKLRKKMCTINIHPIASKRLAHVLSQCRGDNVLSVILFDKLAIIYGNKLVMKYRNERNNAMIRQKMRAIGNLVNNFIELNLNATNLKDILDPTNYDSIIKVINKISGLDEDTGKYRAPSSAYNLSLQIKDIALLLEAECIKDKDHIKRDQVRDLISLIKNGFPTDINKTVSENQGEQTRRKTVRLPTKDDIQALKTFLERGRKAAYSSLLKSFSSKSWKSLAGHTLISIQLFNRRRAGELERILIEDYNKTSFVNENDDIFLGLSETDKIVAKQYARFFIRGKLNRQVSVILTQEIINCIDLFLKHRSAYGVHQQNPYVFGIPSKSNMSYLRACKLMRHYSTMCGAPNPETLRGTELRKQIATACSVYQLSDPLVEDIANHLGHHMNIHKKIYRQSTAREIPAVAQILLKALGTTTDEQDVEEINFIENNGGSVHNNNATGGLEINISNSTNRNNEIEFSELPINQTQYPSLLNSTTPQQPSSENVPIQSSGHRLLYSAKRKSWTSEEKRVVTMAFEDIIKNGIVPTYQECLELKSKHTCLKNRTPPQIKSFVAYANKSGPKTSVKRVTWTTPEKSAVAREFKNYLEKKHLPPLNICESVISKNEVLQKRTPTTLKAYINNLNRKFF